MNRKIYEYDEKIHCIPERGGAYVIFPWNIREEFGRGRVKVHAEFDGQPYDGSIVNMGVKYEDGSVCYIIGGYLILIGIDHLVLAVSNIGMRR